MPSGVPLLCFMVPAVTNMTTKKEALMRKLYNFLCKVEIALCGAGFIVLVSMVFLSAILRFFRFSMAWNIDMALLLLAWTAFLGADIAWREGRLVGVDLVTRRLPHILQKIVMLIVYFAVLTVLVLIVIFGIQLSSTEKLRRFQSLPIPYSLVTVSLVTAAFSMTISTILKIRRTILSFRKNENPGEPAVKGVTE